MTLNLEEAMELLINDLDECAKEITFTFEPAAVAKKIDEIATDYSKYAELPGFRKGKAPKNIIKKKYKENIEGALRDELLRASYLSASKKTDNKILSYSIVQDMDISESEPVVLKIKVEVSPEIVLKDYLDVDISGVEKSEVTQDDVDDTLLSYKKHFSNFEEVSEGSIELGDMALIEFTSDVEEDDFKEVAMPIVLAGNGERWIVIDEEEVLYKLNDNLLGKSVGDELEFSIVLEQDDIAEELKGKEVNYKMNIKSMKKSTPITDEELASKLGVESVDKLKETLEANLGESLEREYKQAVKSKINDALNGFAEEFPLPKEALENQINRTLHHMLMSIQSEEEAKKFADEKDANRKIAKDESEERMKKIFIASEIAKKEDLTVTEADFNAELQGLGQHYGLSLEEVKARIEENGSRDELMASLLVEKVIEHIADKLIAK